MARYDLDGWAKAMGAFNDVDAIAQLRHWRRLVGQAELLIRPVHVQSVELPDEHVYDIKRLTECAMSDCTVVADCLSDVMWAFGRHERGGR